MLQKEGKLPDGQEPAAVDVDYVPTSHLQPLESSTLADQLQVSSHLAACKLSMATPNIHDAQIVSIDTFTADSCATARFQGLDGGYQRV